MPFFKNECYFNQCGFCAHFEYFTFVSMQLLFFRLVVNLTGVASVQCLLGCVNDFGLELPKS